MVDDVTRSPIFAGQPSLTAMRRADSRACPPIRCATTPGRLSGCPHSGRPELVARGTAQALTSIGSRTGLDPA